jgi:cell shape-determining protein MreD
MMSKKKLKIIRLISIALFATAISLFLSSFLFSSFLLYSLFFILFLISILFSLIEDPQKKDGYFLSFFLGFWLDVFSLYPVGFHILILLTITFLIKVVVKRYVRI